MNFMYNQAVIALVALLFISLALVINKIRAQAQKDLTDILNNKESKQLIVGALCIFMIIISVIVYYGLNKIKSQINQQAVQSLQAVLESSNSSLDIWFKNRSQLVKSLVENPEVKRSTIELLKRPIDNLKNDSDLANIRKIYDALLEETDHLGFFIIGKNHLNYGSSRDVNLGVENIIHQQRPDLLADVFQGNTVFIPPLRSDVSLHKLQKGLGSHNTTMFIATPIKNKQNEVIAAFALRTDPFKAFYSIALNARVGLSGETYFIDQQGILISPSRFEKELVKLGVLTGGQSSILNIAIKSPEKKLKKSHTEQLDFTKLNYTHSANEALKRLSGQTDTPYLDYRGNPVMGAWYWNPALNIGIISEINSDEVQKGFFELRNTVVVVLISVILLFVLIANIAMGILRRVNIKLVRVNSELEKRVNERTKSLSDRESKLSDLYENSPIAYASISDKSEITKHNVMFSTLIGVERSLIPTLNLDTIYATDAYKETAKNAIIKANQGEAFNDVKLKLKQPDGSFIYVLVSATPKLEDKELRITLVDVTQREQAVHMLAANERQFRSIVSNLPGAIFRYESTTNKKDEKDLLYISNMIEKITGYKASEFLGDSPNLDFLTMVIPEHRARLQKTIATSLETGTPFLEEITIFDKNKTAKQLQLRGQAIDDEKKNSTYFDGFVLDITERVQLKANLIESENRFKSIIESIADGVIVFDQEGVVQNFSTAAESIFGYNKDDMIDKNISTLEPIDTPKENSIIEQSKQLKKTSATNNRFEVIGVCHNQNQFPIDLSVREAVLDNQKVFIGIFRDITERQIQDRLLKASEERLEAATSGARIGLWEYYPQEDHLRINDVWSTMLGYGATEFLESSTPWSLVKGGMDTSINIIHPDEQANSLKQMQSYLRGQMSEFRHEMRFLCKDGNYKWILSIGRITETDENKDPVRISGIHIDINELKQLENNYFAAKKLAEDANKAKSDFLANMSHEIRTPMNAIIGMSHLALETELDKKQRNYIDKVHRSAESLLGIINDILDFSKIEAGKLDVENVEFNLADTLDNLVNFISIKAEEKHLELLFDVEPNIPMDLVGDPLRLTQVLVNLANNAIKFTQQGEVILHISSQFQCDDYTELCFTISDTGIGMTEEQQNKLFQPFTQADASTTRKHGGTGLGLTISKKLVHLMGGSIDVTSEIDKGSSFSFKITFARQERASQQTFNPANNVNRILVIDDNIHALEIFDKMLTTLGYDVVVKDNANDGLQTLLDNDINTPFQIVFMDWQMPEVNGIEAVSIIQNKMKLMNLPKVFMVTAYGREELKIQLGKLTTEKILTKPVTVSTLNDSIIDSMGARKGILIQKNLRQEKSMDDIESLRGASILAVEDNELNQELILGLLSNNGIACTVANNGQEALEVINNNDFDGILMDCQMPIMDGYTATRKIREIEKFKNMPILAMTANAMTGDREKAIDAGMNDHIPKPINVSYMFKIMNKWIRVKNANNETNLKALPYATETSSMQGVTLNYIDIKDGLNRTMKDEALYLRLLKKFVSGQSNFFESYQVALHKNDTEIANRLIHSLKGLAGNIGAKTLQVASKDLEYQLLQGNVSNEAEAHLKTSLNNVIEELNEFIATQDEQTDDLLDSDNGSHFDLEPVLVILMQMLADYDTQSIEYLQSNSHIFNQKGLSAEYKKIELSIESYDYDKASEIINTIQSPTNNED